MSPLRTKTKVAGDVWIREDLTRPYDAESDSITNGGATNMVLPPGTPLSAAGPILSAALGTATVTGFVLHPVTIPPSEVMNVANLARGVGVVVNESELPDDYAGTTFVAGEMKTALEAADFVVRLEPTAVEVQVK